MLKQVRDQARSRGLAAHDGWGLCESWAAALGPILGVPGGAATGRRFAEVAAHLKPMARPED